MKKFLALLLTCLLLNHFTMAADLQSVNPDQLLEMQKNNHALVIDVRTAPEWQASGVISGSLKLQSFDGEGRFDAKKWVAELEKLKSSPDQAVILVCRSGNRSSKVGELLTQQLGMKNVYHLENGLQSWIKSGHPVSPNCVKVACK